MYLRDLGASLTRRWYLLIVAIVLAALASYGAAQMVGPTYAASGGVVLLPPPDPENPDANRFLALGSLKQAGDVLVRSLTNDATHLAIQGQVSGGDYTVEPDYTTSAPVIVVKATAPDPVTTRALLAAVITRVPVNLQDLQNGLKIDPQNQIVVELVDADTKPVLVVKKQLRATAAAGVLVLGLLAVLIGALDGVLMRRRNRQSSIHAVTSPHPSASENPTPISTAERRPPEQRKARRTQ